MKVVSFHLFCTHKNLDLFPTVHLTSSHPIFAIRTCPTPISRASSQRFRLMLQEVPVVQFRIPLHPGKAVATSTTSTRALKLKALSFPTSLGAWLGFAGPCPSQFGIRSTSLTTFRHELKHQFPSTKDMPLKKDMNKFMFQFKLNISVKQLLATLLSIQLNNISLPLSQQKTQRFSDQKVLSSASLTRSVSRSAIHCKGSIRGITWTRKKRSTA